MFYFPIRKIRFYFWLIRGFFLKHFKIFFASFLLGIIIFLLPVKFVFPPVAFETRHKTKIGMVGNFTPATLPLEIQNLISLGLTKITKEENVTPSAAASFETNDQGKTYTFYLHENLFWHDGTKFKASDINYNFKDVETTVLDEKTIRFKPKEPFSPFPVFLSQPLFKKKLIGLGKYKVKKINLEENIIASLSLAPVEASNPLLIFKFYPTEKTAVTAFKLGEVDKLEKIKNRDLFDSANNYRISPSVSYNSYLVIFFNTKNKLLAEKTFRQALSSALPDFNDYQIATGPLSPSSWAFNPNLKNRKKDIDLAKKLLGKSKEATSSGNKEIVLTTFPSYQPVAAEIAKSWEKLDLKVNLDIINTQPSSFEILLLSYEIPSDPDQYFLWHSLQKTNLSGYANLKLDKLLEDGRKKINQEERKKIYWEFQKIILEDVPAIFLYYPYIYSIARNN